MKMIKWPGFACAGLLAWSAAGQNYSVDWHKIAGGGGTSSGGAYQVSGTLGQPDGGGAISGGNYTVTGGFWSLISVVQTAGLPNLWITNAGNSVVVWWPTTDNCSLQQNDNLTGGCWGTSGYAITATNGVSSITLSQPSGNLFFRLKR